MTEEAKRVVPKELIDSLLAGYKKPEDLIGENGLLKQLTKLLVEKALDAANIDHFSGEADGESALIRLTDSELQMRAKEVVQAEMGGEYVVALNLAPTTPEWLSSLGGSPMKLGLDLSGGVHFLLEVDLNAALITRLEGDLQEVKSSLREEKIRYRSFELKGQQIIGRFRNEAQVEQATSLVRENFRDLQPQFKQGQNPLTLVLELSEIASGQIEDNAIKQNLTSLRNRVNELGVSEPLVSRQGKNRIVVELPGVQDTAEAKRIIGKTANLEFRLEAEGRIGEMFEFRDGRGLDARLETSAVITGENVTDARSSYDENGRPQVNITLDTKGGWQMGHSTRDNVGRRLAVLFIEYKTKLEKSKAENGEIVITPVPFVEKHIISLATVQSQLGKSFRITGIDSQRESSELALLLRAGALAARPGGRLVGAVRGVRGDLRRHRHCVGARRRSDHRRTGPGRRPRWRGQQHSAGRGAPAARWPWRSTACWRGS